MKARFLFMVTLLIPIPVQAMSSEESQAMMQCWINIDDARFTKGFEACHELLPKLIAKQREEKTKAEEREDESAIALVNKVASEEKQQ